MRKNVDLLLGACAEIQNVRLVIVGDDRTYPAQDLPAIANALGIKAKVDFPNYLPERSLAELYAKASVFAFLSEYEGFGLTPVEAMAHGAAPVVLDTEVAREVYGAAAEYLSLGPTLAADLGRSLVALLSDAGARARLVAEGPAVLSRYDWSRTAAQTLAALEDAVLAR